MVRRLKSFWVVLAGWLLGACLGGQTGQPASLGCSKDAAPWRQSVSGVSPEQLALAYQGEYHAELQWAKDPASVTQPISLNIEPSTESGTVDRCNDQLSVPVRFSLVFADGSRSEVGDGLLFAALGTLEPASFSALGQRFEIHADFTRVADAFVISGKLEPRAGNTTDSTGFF